MKPPPFDYVAPTSVAEAVTALARPGAVALAGGQSLLLELAYRDVRPATLVDVNGAQDLSSEVETGGGRVRIGALVRHRALERPADPSSAVLRLLARIAPAVAHPPIRNRGTFCGSVAWGHPAAEWNAVTTALDGVVHLRDAAGGRDVAAPDWYVGDRRTARRPGELVTAVTLVDPPGAGVGFHEHRRTHASFALVAAVVVLTARDGAVDTARVAVAGLGDTPVRAREVEAVLLGRSPASAAEAVPDAVGGGTGDAYLAAAAAEVVRRAVREAAAELA